MAFAATRQQRTRTKVFFPLWYLLRGCVMIFSFLTLFNGLTPGTEGIGHVHETEMIDFPNTNTNINPPKETSPIFTGNVYEYNISYGNTRNPKSLGNISILSQTPRSFRTNAIAILIQKQHSTYRRDSYGLLLQTLQLLRDNYLLQDYPNNLDNVDVFLFHTGEFHFTDAIVLESLLLETTNYPVGIVKLVNLNNTPYWRLPHNVRNDNATEWLVADIFPIGYRHMCRFFAITIWDFFQQLGTYDYILRLDEDSLILSPITYNIFDFMKDRGYIYGFRMCSYELTHHKFVPQWWERWHSKIQHKAKRWPLDWNLCGIYDNFFVASTSFFQSKPVQAFLKQEIDQRGFIYRLRYGDLLVHSLAVYAFAPPERIHRFLDFTYQHMTFVVGECPTLWGAIQAGYTDPKAKETLGKFYHDHHIDRCLAICQKTKVTICPLHVHHLGIEDLSPTYSHLSLRNISLYTIAAGKVELEGMGNLSG